ncbi:sigma-70 family RNA polymerase sigma factor [Opitutus sp. ER46]|uniref:RNA polymerase sigma factor n=1 Tax=Opitutus sp. ER46 TaxID=2161864 RepID=UPI000D305C54|nr:sigma-70 family RNA polymerase sigma factor [Opitutus sp. ER46]PTX92327.1 hypothetical protein DB354_13370 [Opitutus sp. ER46]
MRSKKGTPTVMSEQTSEARIQALEKAIDKYGSFFLAFFTLRTRDADWSRDLAQTLWLEVYDKFSLFRFESKGLLIAKACQVLRDAMRHKRTRGFVTYVAEYPEVAGPTTNREPSSRDEEERLKAGFWEAFPGVDLTDLQKEAFWLNARDGYTLAEVSSRLGVPVATVHDWLAKVKKECMDSYKNES